MKQILLIATLLISAMGCKHKCPTPETKTIDLIPGRWHYADGRAFEIAPPESWQFAVTFQFQIHSPIQKPVTIQYSYSGTDTVELASPNIYPDCYFYQVGGAITGMMQEYKEGPGQGQYVPIYKE